MINIKDFMNIIMESIPKLEEAAGKEFSLEEKREVITGALAKWNAENPDNWLVIPAEFLQ